MKVVFKKSGLYAGLPGTKPLEINGKNINSVVNCDDTVAEYALKSGACELPKPAKTVRKNPAKKDKQRAESK